MSRKQVNPAIVKSMTKFYGSVEAARAAYRGLRDEVRAHNANRTNILVQGGKVLWVSTAGEIHAVYSASVHYAGSPDAAFVLPR